MRGAARVSVIQAVWLLSTTVLPSTADITALLLLGLSGAGVQDSSLILKEVLLLSRPGELKCVGYYGLLKK